MCSVYIVFYYLGLPNLFLCFVGVRFFFAFRQDVMSGCQLLVHLWTGTEAPNDDTVEELFSFHLLKLKFIHYIILVSIWPLYPSCQSVAVWQFINSTLLSLASICQSFSCLFCFFSNLRHYGPNKIWNGI